MRHLAWLSSFGCLVQDLRQCDSDLFLSDWLGFWLNDGLDLRLSDDLLNFDHVLLTFGTTTPEKVSGLAIKIIPCFGLVTSIAFCSASEVIVLALRADPTTIRELEVRIFFSFLPLNFVFSLLVLSPLL